METIVEQIHREFNEAHDKILVPVPNASAEKLYKLGFVRSRSAAAYDSNFERLKTQAEYFRSRYPQYKFITEKQVASICAKYGLLLAPADAYTGDVPHSKVAEIAAFKIEWQDLTRRWLDEWGDFRHTGLVSVIPKDDQQELHHGVDFWICAPVKDIDTEGLTQVGHTLVNVDDPIVLHPVEGGFLIVAAWGPEASDENVVNEKMN